MNEQELRDKMAATRVTLKAARKQWDEQVARSPHLTVSRETFEIFFATWKRTRESAKDRAPLADR